MAKDGEICCGINNIFQFHGSAFSCFSLFKHLFWASLEFFRVPLDNLFLSSKTWCPGFDWNGVNFPHSISYGAVFWNCDQNSFDNTLFRIVLPASRLSLSLC